MNVRVKESVHSDVVLQDASTLMLFNSFGREKDLSLPPFLLFEKALSIKQTSHLQQYIYGRRNKKGNKKEEMGKEGALAWK